MGGREGLIDTAVNSVTFETPIVIIEDNKPKYVKIGEWIDEHLAKNADNIKYIPEQANLEMLTLSEPVYIPTTDPKGNVSWGELTAVTRHDPGERLYKFETVGGRSVTVAESKSMLVWDSTENEFKMKHSNEIKVGDFAPVTASLPTPPVIVDKVDMVEYFPKNEYIYGTEFNKATKLMKEAQGDKFHIPRGWWKENNGKTFTLPYVKKASLTRVTSGRSNTENVKDGFVYPYHATREHATIPDTLELNKENGIFIGLYIAEGCTCEKSGTVSIANVDRGVKDFAINWFNKYGIAHWEETREMKAGTSDNISITSSVFGYSTLLARFLDNFVGHGAHNKYVPDVAFAAPEEFIVGLLNGYIAGDGTVGKGFIGTSSASKRLTEGIAMLCTRLGAFGKMSVKHCKPTNLDQNKDYALSHSLDIRSKFAQRLAEKVDCILESKNQKLKDLRFSAKHRNFDDFNDVVLDAIKEIKVLGVENHPKLYDVTVPSTLNFMIHNGLQVVDKLVYNSEPEKGATR